MGDLGEALDEGTDPSVVVGVDFSHLLSTRLPSGLFYEKGTTTP